MSRETHGMPDSCIMLKGCRVWQQDPDDMCSPYVAVEKDGCVTICFGGIAQSMSAKEWFDEVVRGFITMRADSLTEEYGKMETSMDED